MITYSPQHASLDSDQLQSYTQLMSDVSAMLDGLGRIQSIKGAGERLTRSYRIALAARATPDVAWTAYYHAIEAFLARLPPRLEHMDAGAARDRLKRFLRENADLGMYETGGQTNGEALHHGVM
jgi:hypothetical protein